MELFEMLIIVLQITATVAKKKRKESKIQVHSDESIENLLYFKDCKHKNKDPPPKPVILRATAPPPPPEPICPCPRMCCSMCCDCNAPSPFVSRQMAPLQTAVEPLQQVAPQPLRNHPQPQIVAQQPQIVQRSAPNKKKIKVAFKPPDTMAQPPIGGRRDFGRDFTRENIKSLISHDQDIKKILKDLVMVTMHKVDLVEQVNARKKMQQITTTTNPVTADQEDDYYID